MKDPLARRIVIGIGAFMAAFAWADASFANTDSNGGVGVAAFALGSAMVAVALIRD